MKSKNQTAIFNPVAHKDKRVLIVGIGGVGSTSAYYIAQMGVSNITLCDIDDVEIHNTMSQFYKQSDVGKLKTEALKNNIINFTGIENVDTINQPFNETIVVGFDIVVCAVDSMDVRKEVAQACLDNDVDCCIEARMSGEMFNIFCFMPLIQMDDWLDQWYSSEEADVQACSSKSISYNTGAIGSLIAKMVRNNLVGEDNPFVTNGDLQSFSITSSI